jgi:hypothetical protein
MSHNDIKEILFDEPSVGAADDPARPAAHSVSEFLTHFLLLLCGAASKCRWLNSPFPVNSALSAGEWGLAEEERAADDLRTLRRIVAPLLNLGLVGLLVFSYSLGWPDGALSAWLF